MDTSKVATIAAHLHERNKIDHEIATIINRPMTAGHLGEWIAEQIFGIELAPTATAAAIDGHFTSGVLNGRSVNVKWYLKREGLVDLTESPVLDFYLVFTGPASPAISTKGGIRPWCIESVHLFDAKQLLAQLKTRGVKTGIGASVRKDQWDAAEIYPRATNGLVTVTPDQAALLRLFAPLS